MRVAIVGAGVSGLACAHELEINGLRPVIFEARHKSGELFPHAAVALQLMSRPVDDPIKFLKKKFNLPLTPLSRLNGIIMHTPNLTRTIKGSLGYILARGQEENSAESQLYRLLRTPVHYNQAADAFYLANHFDYVVVAEGSGHVSRILGCWQDLLKTWVRGAVILGDFQPDTIQMWLNTKVFRGGYAYLSPLSSRRASLVQIVTDSNPDEVEKYWRLFWELEGFDYEVAHNFSLRHESGYVYPHQVGNIMLVGNSGGFLEPFLGFGFAAALRSGVLAARSILSGRPYEENIKDLSRQILNVLSLRRVIDGLDNESLERFTAFVTTPGIKQFTYNTNIDVLKYGTRGLGLLEAVKNYFKG